MEEKISYDILINIEEKNNKSFRYLYQKCWDPKKKKIIAVLFNPSKATLTYNDGTVDFLTDFFYNKDFIRKYELPEYGEIIVLNIYSFMSSSPRNLIDSEEEFERKNWDIVFKVLKGEYKYENKDNQRDYKDFDYFIGWGIEKNPVMKATKNYIRSQSKTEHKKRLNKQLERNEKKIEVIDKNIAKKKNELERFFLENNLKERVMCFSSTIKSGKVNKGVHPSKYKDEWSYVKYF